MYDARKRQGSLKRQLLASTIGFAALSWAGVGLAAEDDARQKEGVVRVKPLTVEGEREKSYQTEKASSSKQTAPLLDTPQTITVIPEAIIDQTGSRNLTEVLRSTPGISFDSGENGFSQSTNNFKLRGFDTSGSVFVDGSRDSGSYSRDMFNVEQVEVFKGPAADGGRASAGGYINIVTKTPGLDTFINGDVAYGFDEYDSEARKRTTVDANYAFLEHSALRLNVLLEDSGIPGVELAEETSWGVAPSLAFGLGTNLRAIFAYEHLVQADIPYWGVPGATVEDMLLYNPASAGRPRDAFYGLAWDFDDTTSDALLARFEHDLSEWLTVANQTRWAQVDRVSRFTVPNGYNAGTQQATTSTMFYSRENTTLSNFTYLTAEFDTGPIDHNLTAGFEYTSEKSDADRFGNVNPGNTSIFDPNPYRFRSVDLVPTQVNSVDIETLALYTYDTAKFGEQWELTGGLRAEKYTVEIDSKDASGATTGNFDGYEEDDFNLGGKVGLVYKPVTNGSVYAAFGVAALPPGSYLSNADISRTGDNAFPGLVEGAKGVTSYNYEVGVKWDFLGGILSTTAALFRTEKTGVPITGRDPGETVDTLKGYGEQIVQGIEIGLAGNITEEWQVFGGLALVESERKHSAYLDEVRKRASPNDYGTETSTDGDELSFTPNVTGSLWTTYRLPFGLTVGGGVQHVGSSYLGRTDDALRIIPNGRFGKLPSYTLFNAIASYEVTENIEVRLNVDNITDEEYAVSSNWPGSRVQLGGSRTFLLSTHFNF
ncbi:MAG: TonB-dependent receptor [Alphaproteobacteria bacterium]